MKTKTFDFDDLSHSMVAVERAQKAWDDGYLITVVADLEPVYRREVEARLIQMGVVYQKVKMRGEA